jgi:hypothetical protein
MPALGETFGDQTIARRMYDQGATFAEIGACVGTGANVVSAFAKRHWPRREASDTRQAARPSDPPHGWRQAAAPGTGTPAAAGVAGG